MPSRYHLSPIKLGSETPPGTPPEESPGNRAAVADVSGASWAALIPTDAAGAPVFLFAFCHVFHADLSKVIEVSNSFTFPDYPLDARMDGMESSVRLAMEQSLGAYVVNFSGLHLPSVSIDDQSYGDYITAIAHVFEPAFNINKFFASEGV